MLKQPRNWQALLEFAGEGPLTLLFSARDEARNNAVALHDFLQEQLRNSG